MIETRDHAIYSHVQKVAAVPLHGIQWTEGADAARIATEVWAAFGLNVKNETGLVNHLTEHIPQVMMNDIPTFTYIVNGLVTPVFVPGKVMDGNTYGPTIYFHTEGHAHEFIVRKSRIINWIIEGAELLHKKQKQHVDRRELLIHLFEANQLSARKRGLIDW